MIGKVICRIRGKHAYGVIEAIVGNQLFRLTCLRCGTSSLITQTDIETAIVEALTKEGRYTEIERVRSYD